MGNTQPVIWLTSLITVLTINLVRAQSGEQTIQEGTGFYTDTCQVKIDKLEEVLTKPCVYFAITRGEAYANFHFGLSGWSENLVGFVLPLPKSSISNQEKTPILALFFAEEGEVREVVEGEGDCQELHSPVYTVSCQFTAHNSELRVEATAQQNNEN